ncbi:MAG: hypothetical protein ACKVQV_11910, partial [Bacteroidia bacterium]
MNPISTLIGGNSTCNLSTGRVKSFFTKKGLFYLVMTMFMTLGMLNSSFAQLSGSKFIPGDYATVAAAVIDLNTQGVGAGGVIFEVAAGHTETLAGRIDLTATGTLANPIVFRKDPATSGANPILTAYTGTNLASAVISDGMWSLNGSDYVTIDGINLSEAAGNTTPTTQMEYGYGLFKASDTNGANNNTIQNCVITLNRNNTTASAVGFGGSAGVIGGSIGIAVANCTPVTNTTLITVTTAGGASSNNKFYSNTIQNVNTGIALAGFAGASPFTLCDTGNDIGGTSAGTGNTILNYGGGTSPSSVCAAIMFSNQWSLNFSYNTVNNNNGSGINHTVTNRGIWAFANSNGASANINNNNVTIVGAAASYDMCIDLEMSQSGAVAGQVININNNIFSVTKTNVGSLLQNVVYLNTNATTVNVNGNTITNFTYPGTLTTEAGVIRSGLAGIGTLNINNNTIGGVNLTSTTGTNFIIAVTGSVTTALNITGNNINGVNTTGATTKTLNLIQNTATAITATSNINNNNFQNITHAGSGALNFITATGTPNFITVTGNTFTNLNIATTGTVTLISTTFTNTTGTGTKTISNNSIVTAFNRTGASGSLVLQTDNGSSVTGTVTTVQNNNYSNITVAGTTTITGLNYTDGGTAPTKNFTGNILNNWTGGTGTINCINITYWNGVSVLSNNTVTNINSQGAITGMTLGSTINTATLITVNANTINNLNSTGAGGAVTGISCTNTSPLISFSNNTINTLSSTGASAITGISIGGATNTSVFKNKIYNLAGNNASSTVNGVLVSAGTLVNVFNNLVGDLRAPIANAANPINGLNFTGGTTINASYNTVYLNATSSGALFGSSALSASTTPNLTLRNNVLVNNSTPNAAGFAVAYRRSSTTVSTHNVASNNNLFYAGTPGANRLIYYDGTNSEQSVMGYKARVFTADLNSGTESPTFLSTVGANANFLHIDASVATNIENGGVTVAGIVDDFDGDARHGSTPDIGADEFSGISAAALAAPINFASNTATINSFNITWDDNSVGEAGFVVYRSLNVGGPFTTIVGVVTSTSVASIGTSYSLTQTGLLGGTTYYYQIVANNFTSSAVLSGNATTLSCGSGLAGTFLIPTNYASLTAAMTALVANGMTGPVTLELEASYTGAGETYPITIGNIGCLNPSNTLTIRPEGTVAAPLTITSANTTATIDINGGNYVTIDGRPGGVGTSKYLIVENTSTTAVSAGNAVLIRNESSNNTLTYLNVRSANGNAAANTAVVTAGSIPGAIAIGSTAGAFGNDNNTISFCDVHSAGANLGACIYAGNATTAGSNANNDNGSIINNNLYDFFIAASASAAVDIAVGNNNWTVSGNSVYQSATRTYTGTQNVRGFWITPNTASLTSASGFTIHDNYIGGSTANAGGTTMTLTGTTAYFYMAMDISVGVGAPTSIQNNIINNINMSSSNTSSAAMLGISVANGITNIGNVTGNLIGNPAINTSPYGITFTTTGTLGGIIAIRVSAGGAHNISNNTVAGIELVGNAALVAPSFNGINYSGGTSCIINNNTVGSATLANSIHLSTSSATSTSASAVRGIISNVSAANSTITNNVVANITNMFSGTGTGNTLVGIAVATGTAQVTNNTIRNLNSNSQATGSGSTSAVLGIAYTATTAPAVVSRNTVHSLRLTHPTVTSAINGVGLFYSGPTGTSNVIERNFIHSISTASTTNSAGFLTGMDVAGGIVTIKNNMIRLGIDDAGADIVSPLTVRGITKNAATSNVWNNSVFIGGANVGTSAINTFAFVRSANATDNFRNNIFVNNRSNASIGGKHYSISLNSATTLTLNNNVYYGVGTGYKFGFNGVIDAAVYTPSWVVGDTNSFESDPLFIAPTGNATAVDLHIDPVNPTIVEGQGVAIASVTDDFDGQARAGLSPTDIGADAGNFVNLVCSGTPSGGTAILTGSVICISGTSSVALTGFSNIPGVTLQWQESAVSGGPYTNVTSGTGANSASYTTGTLTANNYYVCIVTCINGGATATSSEVTVVVNNPTIVSTVPGNRCGTGTVVLSATSSAGGTVSWFTAPTGGSPLISPSVPVPVTGYNNDIVANGVGTNSSLGFTYATIGVDGAGYVFIDNTYKYTAANALPTCFMPVNKLAASTQTSGLVHQFQDYGDAVTLVNNALTIVNQSSAYTSPLPSTGTLTLTTPASYANLVVLYESVVNAGPMLVDATVTFTDATTQVFAGNTCVNWFTVTAPAYAGMGRATPTGTIQCGTTPNMFELNMPISVANQAKQVASITFNLPAVLTGANAFNMNYFHAMAVGGIVATVPGSFTTPIISTTTTYYAQPAIGSCIGPRVPVVATVSAPATLSITPGGIVCNNAVQRIVITSTLSDYDSYIWSPLANLFEDSLCTIPYTGNIQDTVYLKTAVAGNKIVTCNALNTGSGCANVISSTFNVQPTATATATVSPNPSCSGSPVTLTASLGTPTTAVLGIDNNGTKIGGNTGNLYRTGTTLNLQMRTQYLIRATELNAAGIQAGPFNSIGFFVLTSATPGVLSNFTLRLGHTTATALTATYQTGPFTDVWFASTYTPVLGLNTHPFSTQFIWNGVDNVVVESCNTLTSGGSGTTLQTFTTPTQTNMANLVAGGCTAAAGGATGFTNCRPVIAINGNVSPTPSGFSWSDGVSVVGTTSPLVVSPTSNTSYTCTITANGCPYVSNTINQVVIALPPSPTASAPSTQCGYAVPTASVTSNSSQPTPIFSWYDAPTGGNLLQSSTSTTFTGIIITTTTFYVAELISPCESPRVAVVANVSAYDPIATTASLVTCVGTPNTFTVSQTGSTNIYAYSWTALPLVGSGSTGTETGSPQTFTATIPGFYNYIVTGVDAGLGCTVYDTVTVNNYIGLSGTVSATQISGCANPTGLITANVSGAGTVVNEDFTSGILPGNMTSAGNDFAITGGRMQLTSATNSKNGGVLISNPTGLANNDFQIDFDFITTTSGSGPADGLSYSYGDDVVALPNSAGTPPGISTLVPENGSGTKLKLSFDAINNTGGCPSVANGNVSGIYLMYNETNLHQGANCPGVLFYSPNTTWRATTTTGATTHVTITINSLGQVSMSLNNVPVVTNQQLPPAYLSANKSNWKHAFAARTGGLNEGHYIDNLVIQYNNFYEYSINGGASWSTTNPIVTSGPGTYTVDARYVSVPACSTVLGTATINTPVFTTTSTSTSVCSYSPTMPTLAFTPSFASGATYQWEYSPAGANTWLPVSGATNATYVPAAGFVTANTDFRCIILCGGVPTVGSPTIPITITFDTPIITGSTPGSRCGVGTVNLSATGSANTTLNWYAAASGGTAIGTGNSFTTPSISSTTNFYVAASSNGGQGLTPVPGGNTWNQYTTVGGFQTTAIASASMVFDALTTLNIATMDIYPSAVLGTSFTIEVRQSSGSGTLIASYTGTTTVVNSGTPSIAQTVPVNFNIPAGTNYVIGFASNPNTWRGNITNFPYPFLLPGILNIQGSSFGTSPGTTLIYQYYFYNWVVTTGCESSRTAVAATVTTPPAITVSPNATLCDGQSTTLTVTSSNDPDYSYVWAPSGFNGASYPVNPSATSTYTVTATDTTAGPNSGCATLGSVTVTVNPVPLIDATPSTINVCGGGSVNLNVTNLTPAEATFGTQANQNTTTTYPAPYSVYFGSQRMQMLITAAELTSAGYNAGSPLAGIKFPVVSLGANWGGSLTSCQSFQMSIGNTALTSITAFQTGLTQVIAPGNYTPTVGYGNTHTFSTPFIWNGTSNLIVETTFGNNFTGTTSDAVIQYNTPTAFQSTIVYRADGVTAAAAAAATTVSFTFSARPDFKLVSNSNLTYLWSPTTGLNNPTSVTPLLTVAAGVNQYYYVTATNPSTGCTAVDSILIASLANPKPIIVENDTTLCNPSQIYIHVVDTGVYAGGYPSGTQFTWSAIGVPIVDLDSISSINGSSYSVIVTLPNGCTSTSDTITVLTKSVAVVDVITNASCVGGGSIEAIVTSGLADYNFVWSTDLAQTNIVRNVTKTANKDTLPNLSAGTYYLQVYDEAGTPASCNSGVLTYVVNGAAPIVASVTPIDITCNGNANGAADVTWTGGVSP